MERCQSSILLHLTTSAAVLSCAVTTVHGCSVMALDLLACMPVLCVDWSGSPLRLLIELRAETVPVYGPETALTPWRGCCRHESPRPSIQSLYPPVNAEMPLLYDSVHQGRTLPFSMQLFLIICPMMVMNHVCCKV